MEVLDYLDLAAIDPKYVSAAVNKYIAERKDMLKTLDVKVRISVIRSAPTARAGKADRQNTLAQLIEITNIKMWDGQDYFFNFEKGEYKHGKQMLHLTAGEAVALYQRVVRGQVTEAWSAFFTNMKKKFGPGFLKEIL